MKTIATSKGIMAQSESAIRAAVNATYCARVVRTKRVDSKGDRDIAIYSSHDAEYVRGEVLHIMKVMGRAHLFNLIDWL